MKNAKSPDIHVITIKGEKWWQCSCGWGVGLQPDVNTLNIRLINHLETAGQVIREQ